MNAALTVDSIASNLDQLAAEELVGTITKNSFFECVLSASNDNTAGNGSVLKIKRLSCCLIDLQN